MKTDIMVFAEGLRSRRSVAQAPDFTLKRRDVLSESCLGLCVE